MMLKEAIEQVERMAKDAHAAAILKELPLGNFLVRSGNDTKVIETDRPFKPISHVVSSLDSLLDAMSAAIVEADNPAANQVAPSIVIDRDLEWIKGLIGDRTNETAPWIEITWSIRQMTINTQPMRPNQLAKLCRTEYIGWMPGEISSKFDSITFEAGNKVYYKSAHGGDGLGRDIAEKTSGGGFGSAPPKEIEVSIPLILEKDLPQTLTTKLYFEYEPSNQTVQMVWTEMEYASAIQALAAEVEHAIRTKMQAKDRDFLVLISG
jgi:hypothetical protein